MAISRIIAASARFALINTWPVLAVTALYLPFQFVFDFAQDELATALVFKDRPEAGLAFVAGVVVFQAMLDTVYKAGFWAVAWSRLTGTELTYGSWRAEVGRTAPVLFGFFLIYYAAYLFSMALGMLPFALFLVATTYAEIVIVMERLPLRPAFRRNLALLQAAALPAVALSLVRFLLLALIPMLLTLVEYLPRNYQLAGAYLGQVLVVPVDVAALVLYHFLTLGREPKGFPEMALEESDDDM